jgi:cell division control protein 6
MEFNSNKDRSIFENEEALTEDVHNPVLRNEEIETIADSVRPLVRGTQPDNLLVYGDSGIGKTTCASYVLDELDQQTKVKTSIINCWHYNTRISLLTQLLIDLGYPAPRKGKPVDELVAKLREWLDKNSCVAVGLDEFDQLEHQNEVAYDLYRLSQETENCVGTVMISNQPPSEVNLDPRSQSRLSFQMLEFEPYSVEELTEVLEKRAEKAFRDGAYDSEVIEYIAEKVAEGDSDCRRALKMLQRAGRKADRENDRLTLDHVADSTKSS